MDLACTPSTYNQSKVKMYTRANKKGDISIRRIVSSDFEAGEYEYMNIKDYQDTLADESDKQCVVAEKIS
jgi:hypothetical protein